MDLEVRGCWRCGARCDCLVELCERCDLTIVVICEVCVEEAGEAALDWQAKRHSKICGPPPPVAVQGTVRCGRCGVTGHNARTCETGCSSSSDFVKDFHETSISSLLYKRG
jgi:hypothetical protein